MKQIENRNFTDSIRIVIYPTLKEKLKILLCNRMMLSVDLNVDSNTGIIEKYDQLKIR